MLPAPGTDAAADAAAAHFPWYLQENQNCIVFEAANSGALFDGVTARVNFLVTGRCQQTPAWLPLLPVFPANAGTWD